MKKLIYLILVLTLFLFCGTKQEKVEKIMEDGVEVVLNHLEPYKIKGEPFTLHIEEEFTIDTEKDEIAELGVPDIGRFDIDSEGNIYFLQGREKLVFKFNKEGHFVTSFGRRGQGPGEIQRAINIYITPLNEILINDRGAQYFHFITLGGEYIRSIYQGRLSRPQVDTENNIIARRTIIMNAKEVRFVLKKFDSELNELFTIFSYERELSPGVLNLFAPRCYWEISKDDTIIWGYADKYEFQIHDSDGRLIRKIIKDHSPVIITKEEKQEWTESTYGEQGVPPDIKVSWKPHHNVFQFMNVDDEGRIFVQTYEKTTDGSGYYCDVFDSEGKYIAKIPLRTQPWVWKRGKLYTIEEDEDGFQMVKRYKVTWKY